MKVFNFLLYFTFGILWHTAQCELWIPVPINPMSNDFIIGYQTESSVLVHSNHLLIDPAENEIVLGTVEWFGNHIIRKVEAIDQDSVNGGHVYQFAGGISERKIQLNFRSSAEGYGINFIIRVYAEPQPPNDFDFGNLTSRSRLVHSNIVEADSLPNEIVRNSYSYSSITPISAFKIRDLATNGFGGIIEKIVGGINTNNVTIHFQSSSPGHGFRFNVYFYVEPIDGNDFFMGYLTPGSVLAKTEYVWVTGEPNEIVKTSVVYQGERAIRRIAAYDRNIYGTGGFVSQIISGGIGQSNVTIEFSGSQPGGAIDFRLEIFIEGENNFVIGKLQKNSVLINRKEIYVPAVANQNQNTTFDFEAIENYAHLVDHTIAMVEALDMTFDGTGGIVELLSGGQNNTHIQLSLRTSAIGQAIHFFVTVYGTSKSTGANDFMVGQIKPTSKLTHQSSLEIQDFIGKAGGVKTFGSISFPRRINEAIQFIQGFDLNGGFGGRFLDLQFTNASTKFDFLFESVEVSGKINFLVEVYYG